MELRCPYCQMPLSALATRCPHCTQDVSWRYDSLTPEVLLGFAAGTCSALYLLTFMILNGYGGLGKVFVMPIATALCVWGGVSFLQPATQRKVCTLIVTPALLAICWFVIRYVLPFAFKTVRELW